MHAETERISVPYIRDKDKQVVYVRYADVIGFKREFELEYYKLLLREPLVVTSLFDKRKRRRERIDAASSMQSATSSRLC